MFDFSADKNVIEIKDGLTGDTHEFYYRLPTTSERAKYRVESVQRKGNKVISKHLETRVKYACAILTGFKLGTFSKGDEEMTAENTPDWKTLFAEHRPDLLEAVAMVVFENSATPAGGPELEFTAGTEEEEIEAPLVN